MENANYIIGRGELLTGEVPRVRGGSEAEPIYSVAESLARLTPGFDEAAAAAARLPAAACPRDYAAARLVMNPSYIAKSYFPVRFLAELGLQAVGSRETKIVPQKWTKKSEAPRLSATTEILLLGKREAIRQLKAHAATLRDGANADLVRIEAFGSIPEEERLRLVPPERLREDGFLEIGLHLLPEGNPTETVEAFVAYAAGCGATAFPEHAVITGQLAFLPVHCPPAGLAGLARFSLMRVMRPQPALRRIARMRHGPGAPCRLPDLAPLSMRPKVAILDGGLPAVHSAGRWVGRYERADATASDVLEYNEHGLAVTGAYLFGAIGPDGTAGRPYAPVDAVRVLDAASNAEDPFELYRTLGFIEDILVSRRYEFLNLSLGPSLPVEDHEVHLWTARLDELLKDGKTFLTVAAGNNGDSDAATRQNRVQVPSDCVNALTVGAADAPLATDWARASYSAVGPGRRPGVVKPDVVAFGGSPRAYFHTLAPGPTPMMQPNCGTSFAAPLMLRMAVGIRAVLGDTLSPLAIKALLIHGADRAQYDPEEVGRGFVPDDLSALIRCEPGTARIVYQGELRPGKSMRAPVPLPESVVEGFVTLKATLVFASDVDPQDSVAYTKAGLTPTFRPHAGRVEAEATHAKSKGFFESGSARVHESEQRSDIGKWETVMCDQTRMRASSLHRPHFDIHYTARDGGGTAGHATPIPYALILSIHAPRHPRLHTEILDAYQVLVEHRPVIELPALRV